jgi:tRNA threonylcarbamoyladenosine biosynthesis protein TsaE
MKISSEQEMLNFGREFAKKIKFPMVIELIGDIGAGKTTFARGLAEGLGIKEPITSPSFTISKSYALPNNKQLTHYDFYRLKDPGLMLDNLNESINNKNTLTIIEWSNSVKDILPNNHTTITIKKNQNDSRTVNVNNRSNTFRDISRPTGSKLARSHVTTGATKRVEKGVVRLFLDTSAPETILKINDKEYKYPFANDLAEKLLQFIKDKLDENNKTWQDITEIEFMSGPGSFTGLRIGATVINTLAHELNIPLKDHKGKTHKQIIPEYDRPANISKPVK